VQQTTSFNFYMGQIADLALSHRLPTVQQIRDFVEAGGLMSYGPSLFALGQRSAWYMDRIVKGTSPADLPVEQPTRFELILNLKTAKTIGIELPTAILLRADEVIE
jgi:putative ABC transport system substrate-binding protein